MPASRGARLVRRRRRRPLQDWGGEAVPAALPPRDVALVPSLPVLTHRTTETRGQDGRALLLTRVVLGLMFTTGSQGIQTIKELWDFGQYTYSKQRV